MRFELAWEQRGFGNSGSLPGADRKWHVHQGSDVVPSFGHDPRTKAKGLGPRRIRAVIGTSLDQVAVGPGILLREWKQNARRYF